ncbi:LOW QUALITY PROTEIN: cilia- and flagella-associated protein 337-like [Erethizon dorsatum]
MPTWKKMPKVENMPNITIHNATTNPNVTYIHWRVHGDWVTQKNLLLTGGMDRIIRAWNPYLPGKPTGMLRSHTAPVIYIHTASEDNKIFSMSTDSTIKVFSFLSSSKASSIKGKLTACLYLPGPQGLCVATNVVALLHLRRRPSPEPQWVLSHQEPVVCCRYNPAFRHAVSCCEASMVKIWDFETGRQLSEFTGAHGQAGITCLTFDSRGRRYVPFQCLQPFSRSVPVMSPQRNTLFPGLITGGRDGYLKIWGYSNGHCLHTLKQDENQSELDCTYMEVNKNKCIIAVGWDRRINVYFDAAHDFHHFWKPQPRQDDLNRGHKEDILCVVQCPPFLLATSSYDGEIITWKVISGHGYCKLNTPGPSDALDPQEGPDLSASCLAFLKTRAAKLDASAASLIANAPGAKAGPLCCQEIFPDEWTKVTETKTHKQEGSPSQYMLIIVTDQNKPNEKEEEIFALCSEAAVASALAQNFSLGSVTFWRLFGGAGTCANFTPSRGKAQVSSIAVTEGDALVYLADQQGFVHVYDIKEYGLWGPELQPPKNVTFRRAHVSMVTSLELIEEENILLSSSLDRAVCLWTRDGVYIGTFGQNNPCDIFTPASWSLPRVPCEIPDPQRVPAHLLCKEMLLLGAQQHWGSGMIMLPAQIKLCLKAPEPGSLSICQALQCHEVACVSALGEKPDLSIIDSDLLNLNFLMQKEGSGATQDS